MQIHKLFPNPPNFYTKKNREAVELPDSFVCLFCQISELPTQAENQVAVSVGKPFCKYLPILLISL